MSDSGVKIEVHLIQNFAPSNLNRDDTGQPKSATFGGLRRARISSQCGKRAIREWWREHGSASVGARTKRLQQLIGDKIAQNAKFTTRVGKEDLAAGIRIFTDAYYAGADQKAPEKTNVLVFISQDEVEVCATAVIDLWEENNGNRKGGKTGDGIASIVSKLRAFDAKSGRNQRDSTEHEVEQLEDAADSDVAKGEGRKRKRPALTPLKEVQNRIEAAKISADIALFGRMLAEQPGRNTDGACQVAHPISTHKVDMEMDYYTAVDDLNPDEETGAGMIGVVGFNSACYYRYALVDRDQLARNLVRKTERRNGDWAEQLSSSDYAEADSVIRAFLEAMVYAVPTGKQNSFAAQNLPSFGLFVRRNGGVPVSLANAFSRPVRPTKDDDDLIGLSVAALSKHWNALQSVYGVQGVTELSCFHLQQEGRLSGLEEKVEETVAAAIDVIMKEARQR